MRGEVTLEEMRRRSMRRRRRALRRRWSPYLRMFRASFALVHDPRHRDPVRSETELRKLAHTLSIAVAAVRTCEFDDVFRESIFIIAFNDAVTLSAARLMEYDACPSLRNTKVIDHMVHHATSARRAYKCGLAASRNFALSSA